LVAQSDEALLELVKRLINRLERLSADSAYAHQASGLRGSLLRTMERIENGQPGVQSADLDQLIESGYEILKEAAKEIGAGR